MKEERLIVRISEADKKFLKEASKQTKIPVSKFCLDGALKEAKKALKRLESE